MSDPYLYFQVAMERRRIAVQVLTWLMVTLVGLVLSIWGQDMVVYLDEKARAWWSPPQ